MKTLRKILRSVLALGLLFSAVPSWACVSACKTGSVNLSCVRVCARSHDLLTQGGKLPAIGSGLCSVGAIEQAPAVLSASAELSAPVLHALPMAPIAFVAPTLPVLVSSGTRGPPAATPYLSSQHPYANGPPTLL